MGNSHDRVLAEIDDQAVRAHQAMQAHAKLIRHSAVMGVKNDDFGIRISNVQTFEPSAQANEMAGVRRARHPCPCLSDGYRQETYLLKAFKQSLRGNERVSGADPL